MNSVLLRSMWLGCVALIGTPAASAATWSSGVVNLPIPDNNDVLFRHSIDVGENTRLTDLTVSLAIDHGWIGDFQIWLEHPQGQMLFLVDRPGEPDQPNIGDSSDLSVDYPIRFNDAFAVAAEEAGDACEGDSQIVGLDCVGDFHPEDSLLAGFGGLPTRGTWTLIIRDATIGHAGTLGAWSLEVSGSPVPLPGALWGLATGLVAVITMSRARKR